LLEEGRRILLVDDESDLRVYLELYDYIVLQAAGCKEALAKVRTALPDLVVLVVMTPGLDGIDILRAVRAISTLRVCGGREGGLCASFLLFLPCSRPSRRTALTWLLIVVVWLPIRLVAGRPPIDVAKTTGLGAPARGDKAGTSEVRRQVDHASRRCSPGAAVLRDREHRIVAYPGRRWPRPGRMSYMADTANALTLRGGGACGAPAGRRARAR
jgi:hypothetical protein